MTIPTLVESCADLRSYQCCLHSNHLASDAKVALTPDLRSFPSFYFSLHNYRYLLSVWPFIWLKLQQCDDVEVRMGSNSDYSVAAV